MLLPLQMLLSAINVTKKRRLQPTVHFDILRRSGISHKEETCWFPKSSIRFWFVILGGGTGIGGLCGPFKKTLPVILSLILWPRTVANGQRSRWIAASRGLIQDYSETFFSAVPSVP